MLDKITVKDISKYVDKNTKLIIDADGLCYKPAAAVDQQYIEVKHLPSGRIKEFKNITEFKGNVRGQGKIGAGSWLASENTMREVHNQRPFALSEFEIIPKTKLKLSLSMATKNIDKHISEIKDLLGIQNALMILGEGECFRYHLPLPAQYKSNRSEIPRPTQLKNCRQHILDNHYSKLIKDGIFEADDVVNMYAWKGYIDYLKTGKFSFVVASNDKDARGCPGLLLDWSKEGDKFKYPNPFLIQDTDKTVGGAELVKGSFKGYGFMNLIYQMLAGDSADHYDPRSICGKSREDNFGDTSLYTSLINLKTPKELLEFTIETYKEWYPDGLHFTAWNGKQYDEDIYWWLEIMFSCVYMKRSKSDKTTFKDLCHKFEVSI